VDFNTLSVSSEFVTATVMAFLDTLLILVLLYAYWRCRRGAFLVLGVGAVTFLYMNVCAGLMLLFSLAHVTAFPPPVMRVLMTSYTFVGPFGGLMWLVGTVLLVRYVLSLRSALQT
jgi:hypothetical protein